MISTVALVCCVAGKSGGHILPCLQFAKQQYLAAQTPLLFISTTAALDKKIIAQFPEITDHLELELRNVPYRSWWKLPLFGASFITATWRSFWYLKKNKPSCIISTGGFVAVPVCLAAWVLRIPLYLFELNVVPGKAIAALTKLATTVFICFEETRRYIKKPCVRAPYPLRFTEKDRMLTQAQARAAVGLLDQKTLLILGGSQGSHFLNGLIQQIPLSVLKTYQVVHQTGVQQVEECTSFYTQHAINAQVFAYRDNLAPYYQAADLIICRAGAGTLFEALFFNKPSIVVPLEIATTAHQLENGYAMEQAHPDLFRVVRQQDVVKTPELLTDILLFRDKHFTPGPRHLHPDPNAR